MTDNRELEALVRRQLQASWTRRGFLGRAGLAAGMLAVGPGVLAACGSDDDSEGGGDGETERTESDTLRISNWPLYIDAETIPAFQDETGLTVEYTEDVNDNEEYFAKIREPLSRGQDIGADLFIVTDFLVARLIELGWLAEYDSANVPNKANLVDSLAHVDYDPERKYSLPWFSGFTAMAYNIDLTGEEITTTEALFDPKYRGKVTMFSDMRDALGMVILMDKGSLDDLTEADIQAAADRVAAAKDEGQIRRFTGNDYGDDLVAGNVAVCQAYSGDVAQLQLDNPNLRFVLPETGGLLFSDNMVMPTTTENIVGAEKWMDFVYDPANNARLTAEVQFIPPVQQTGEELEKIDPELAANPLINPPESEMAKAFVFPTLTEEEEVTYTDIYTQVTAS
ncbi:MAG: Putrescine-binding periplasmic protein [Acidimicrobiales bacterium]|nr:MAG: spermidine/putrescine ABC transporter substrate-binding protein [Actinomycetota bacterium]MBV6508695.1 Putrescine-binding periplasmic protein [Acidimicrobiales bacterium]RIK08215.1 MAG: twin-arginine translocation pathway signal protein [Acidobacteriota bacterium]